MLLPPICSTCPKFQKVYPGRCFPLSFVQNHHAARGRVPCHMSHVPPPLLLFAVNASPRSVSDGSSLLNRSTYPPSSSTPSSPFLFLLPRLKSQYGSFPTSFDPELLNAPRRICDPVSASSRSLSGRIQLMNAYGTIVIVAVRTRHPASTLGRENAEEGGGGGGGGPADDDGVGGLCFPKCRRSSRATWGGILLAIWGVGRHSLRARERERGDGTGRGAINEIPGQGEFCALWGESYRMFRARAERDRASRHFPLTKDNCNSFSSGVLSHMAGFAHACLL